MTGICRVGDSIIGTCNADAPGHPRTFIGTWITGSSKISSDGINVIRVGDTGMTDCNHTIVAIGGSIDCSGEGVSLQRIDDPVIIVEGGYGTSVSGSSKLFIN